MRVKILLVCLLSCLHYAAGSSLDELRRQLDEVFADPSFARAIWAVKIQSAENGQVLYQRNAHKYVMPASNMKLVTAVAALERMGFDFRFETRLETNASIAGSSLDGDLIVRGSGDPTLGARLSAPDPEEFEAGDPVSVFGAWAEELKAKGIQRIRGDLVGDDSIFEKTRLGAGWSWDDLPYGYSAEISGLQFNENVVLARIFAGKEPGDPVTVESIPETSYLSISAELQTVAAHEDWDFQPLRTGSNQVVLKGSVPAGRGPFWRSISVEDPTLFFLTVLKETFQKSGISVDGGVRHGTDSTGQTVLTHTSPDLEYTLRILLKVSQNLYAETLARWLDPRPDGKTFEGGLEEIEDVLTRIGIPNDAYEIADGSGLSRYSFLTADMISRLLHHAYRQPYRDRFMELLPIAGKDGTISARMINTAAEENVRAKTGTLANVRALSGFVRSADAEVLSFSMIVNNYLVERRSAEFLQDLTLEYLANFKR